MGNLPSIPFCDPYGSPSQCIGNESRLVTTVTSSSVLLTPSEGHYASDLQHGSSTKLDPSYANRVIGRNTKTPIVSLSCDNGQPYKPTNSLPKNRRFKQTSARTTTEKTSCKEHGRFIHLHNKKACQLRNKNTTNTPSMGGVKKTVLEASVNPKHSGLYCTRTPNAHNQRCAKNDKSQ